MIWTIEFQDFRLAFKIKIGGIDCFHKRERVWAKRERIDEVDDYELFWDISHLNGAGGTRCSGSTVLQGFAVEIPSQ
jgi:hypothetical protein